VEGFGYTPEERLVEGEHLVTAQVYDQAGNQAETGPWIFNVVGLGGQRHHPAPGRDPGHHAAHADRPRARRSAPALPGDVERGG
jgi:hypothetical protein